MKWLYTFVIGRRLIQRANGWIAITSDEVSDFAEYDIESDSVIVIPNGVDPELYEPTHDDGDSVSEIFRRVGESPYLIFLGRLNSIKGPDLLLDAFLKVANDFDDVQLAFVGPDDGLMSELKDSAFRSSVNERIHFIGYLRGREKVEAIRNACCMVIPSRNEAMSIVVLKAGICGTPVLFTDQCGLEEFAQEQAWAMVEPTVEGIRQGLEIVLSNRNKLADYGARLESLVREKFLWPTQARSYVDFYRKILSNDISLENLDDGKKTTK